MENKNHKKTKVLIVGGGFAGIKAGLDMAGHPGLEVRLISDHDNFRYYPSLYRAAVGGKKESSAIPLSEIFSGRDIKLTKGAAEKIDREAKKVILSGGKSYSYDVLVMALGVVTNYFGIKGLQENSFGVKSLEDAYELRDHLHNQLLSEQKPDQSYVIIGGGPTGVELAGELPGYLKQIMRQHGLETQKLHIELIEAAPRLMPRMPKAYSRAVARRLRKLGVSLQLGKAVQAETADSLMVDGQHITTRTVVWTAGVTNHPFFKDNDFALNDRGKVIVGQYLQTEPDIYVIGDNADTEYSGMAQTALYDGVFIARNLKRQAEDKDMYAYKPKLPVYVTPAGPGWAAVLWGKTQIYGRAGWLLRNAADFRAYNSYEPWFRASRHWVAQHETEETCPVCAAK